MVGAQVLSTDLADGATATTLNGADVTVTINGDGIFINDAQVTVADIVTDNGVVHVIDAVLLPPTEPETTTVVDVIVNSDVHNLLEAAVIEADLAGALSGEGPFTVFAPTDDAFLALAGALNASAEDLLALPELADILLYHVVGAQVLSTDLADGATATTLNGADVTVTINDDGIFINDAQVTVADIVTDNGVVHVIDAVLLPPTEPETTTVVDVIVNSDVHNILEAAVIEADLAGALSGEGPFTVFAPTDDAFLALPSPKHSTPPLKTSWPCQSSPTFSFTMWWELRCSLQTLPTAPPPPPSSEKTSPSQSMTMASSSTMPKSPWPISSQTMVWFT